ncbi:hypothetical protein CDD82_1047 [Ophiocordyceps australis]|uniref:Uncharacterized protein n=1 Tax=Ophiocordyceps australis TaxID=1399860 RepID=A0A2C5ZN98_9HYPO|nr:hypothetical protein CDD82_1047 [Ophiocordyceps australis]
MASTLHRPTLKRPLQAVCQRRWAQVHHVRLLATSQTHSDVIEKYRSKLEEKARLEGFSGIDALRNAYADKITAQKRRDQPPPPQPKTPKLQELLRKPGPKPQTDWYTTDPVPEKPLFVPKAQIQTLDQIIDLEKVRNLPDDELAALWRLRYSKSPKNVCAVIPASTYKAMERVAIDVPRFIIPVPCANNRGIVTHLLQWMIDRPTRTSTVIFTQLAEFKARREFALPHTSITHYLDLMDERGIVLMQGQVVKGRGITPNDVHWLTMCMQRFYGSWDLDSEREMSPERRERAAKRRQIMDSFSRGDAGFKYEDLLNEIMTLGA